MTPKERDEGMKKLFASDLATTKQKGHDYSGDGDALKNFRDFGWEGIVVRIGDKYSRLKCFAKQGTFRVHDESLRDTLKDIRVYSMLAELLYMEDAERYE